jgi:hypothetical protein
LETTDRLVWEISVDAQGDSALRVIRNDEVRNFITVNQETYRVEGDTYVCVRYVNSQGQTMVVTQSGEDELFASDTDEAFAAYSLISAGVQVMSVAEEDGSETLNGITTTRYKLISKLPEALEILKEFPSDDLQQTIEDIPPFYIDGAINIDTTTQALIRFSSVYADLEKKQGNTFLYAVSELGNQPDITAPDPAKITTPCQGGTPLNNTSTAGQ